MSLPLESIFWLSWGSLGAVSSLLRLRRRYSAKLCLFEPLLDSLGHSRELLWGSLGLFGLTRSLFFFTLAHIFALLGQAEPLCTLRRALLGALVNSFGFPWALWGALGTLLGGSWGSVGKLRKPLGLPRKSFRGPLQHFGAQTNIHYVFAS